MRELELWGGHECTVNRVGDHYKDQTRLSGHQDRIEDLERFAELGLKALRYPVVWERVAPQSPEDRDWTWTDARLERIRELGMRPIAGLLHHGSGPHYTSLVSDNFVELFAGHARAAAERYPWVGDWTPVNEPLTTARFSALYGHWYPHARDERAFWTALLNQIDATRAAMTEIRRVNPQARLIQTEDLGQTYSTPPLADQAAFENIRRWLTWDLLCGKVVNTHPFWPRLSRFGLTDRARAIADNPCPPDVLGVNHYLTSERFLDHRTERYPEHRIGGNDHMAYADVEACRVLNPGPLGLEGLMDQAWRRYGRTLAVTETHNGCTREEQMRWTLETWRAAEALRGRGVDVEAVTAWALLGSHDWNSLLTQDAGHYEVGAFDLRGGDVRETGVSTLLRALGKGEPLHPVLNGPGWWRRDARLEFQPVNRTAEILPARRQWIPSSVARQPLLIAGATGTLGQALARACEWRGLAYVLTSRDQLALDDPSSIDRVLDQYSPWALINAAGWVRVDDAESEPEACMLANAEGAANLARAAAQRGLHCTTFSSDLVFDGSKPQAYVESDAPAPLNVYGRSKAVAEGQVLQTGGPGLVIRTAAFFSPDDRYNFADWVVRELSAGRGVRAAGDSVVTPTYVPDLVQSVLDLVIDGETGIWHLSNGEAMSWAEFGRRVADAVGLDAARVRSAPAARMEWAAARPRQAALTSERATIMPSFASALDRYALAVREDFGSFEANAARRRDAEVESAIGCVA